MLHSVMCLSAVSDECAATIVRMTHISGIQIALNHRCYIEFVC